MDFGDNPLGTILWGQSHLQKLQETVSGGSGLVNSLKLYYTQSQMLSQELFEASFEIAPPKTLENIQQNVCS